MVKAMEPKAPIGASRMIQRMIVNITVESFSTPRVMLAPASPLACRPKPNRTEMSSTGRILFPVRALSRVAGIMASTNPAKPSWLAVAAGGRPWVEREETSTCSPLHDVDDDQADHHGDCGQDLEVDQRLQADPADHAQVVHGGDAVDDGAEDDRRDHHLHQSDEAVAQRFQIGTDRRPEPADGAAG